MASQIDLNMVQGSHLAPYSIPTFADLGVAGVYSGLVDWGCCSGGLYPKS